MNMYYFRCLASYLWFKVYLPQFLGVGRVRSCKETAWYVYWKHWVPWSASFGMSFSSICLYVVFVLSENLIRQFASFKVYEILDNAIDEAQAGFASKIDVILLADNSVCITDNGRGVCALLS